MGNALIRLLLAAFAVLLLLASAGCVFGQDDIEDDGYYPGPPHNEGDSGNI